MSPLPESGTDRGLWSSTPLGTDIDLAFEGLRTVLLRCAMGDKVALSPRGEEFAEFAVEIEAGLSEPELCRRGELVPAE